MTFLSQRRRELMNPSLSISLDTGTSFNQFESIPRHSSLSKSARKKNSSRTIQSASPWQSLIENNSETLDLNHSRISSILPSRFSLSNQNQQRIESTYPQNILIGPNILDKPCACHVTMRFRFDPTLPPVSYNSRRDEVTIFQVANNGSSWIVFKGFLKMNDSFAFKSQRSIDDRFHLKLEVNGSLDTTISACCEHPYRRGGRIDDGDSSFWIETVEDYTSCAKCRENIDGLPTSDDENMDIALGTTSEESEAEEDQSVASDKSTIKPQPSELKHAPPIKPSSSAATDTKKVPEPSVSAPKAQSLPPSISSSVVQKITTQKGSSTDNESELRKYVTDVMQQALSKPKSTQTIPPRCIGNLENFTILYIDQNEEKDLNLLRPTVNFIRVVNDPNTLGTVLAACADEKVIAIVSLDHAQVLLPKLQQEKLIQSIYLLSKQTHPPEWINEYGKIIGIYRNIESIRDHLIKTLPQMFSRMIPMEITSKDSTSDLPFTYCQLLEETILCQDDELDLRKDMLAFCRIHYADNQEELHQIEEFQKSFTDAHSIQWYTRHCFLSKILTRAFRTQEIDLLFKMRYFIQCLHKQIQSIALKEPTMVYTTLDIEQETIRKFEENINGLVLFRSFLPATLTECPDEDTQPSVVFSIRLGPDCAANIQQFRSSDCKIDVLINLNTIFRIISINRSKNGVPTVSLESVPHDDSHFQQLTESLRKEIQAPVVILQITKLLLKTDHYWEDDYLTELIYQDKSFEGDGTLLASLAAAHHLLGNIHVNKRDFEGARYQFFKSLRAFQLFLPYNHPMLSSTYNNIGSMFYQDDHHEHAIKFHEMALQSQFKSSSPDMDSVATYSTNIGAVYVDQKKYSEAVKHLKRAEIIREKMPIKDNLKSLISLFEKISSCLWRTNEPKEALKYYQKTLDYQLKLPNPSPHPLSVTYYNLCTAYVRIGDYDDAVHCAEKSIEYLKMTPNHDSELKDNQAQLEIARQKQWLKQVLSV